MFGALVIISVGVLTAATDVVRAEPRARPQGMKLYKTAMAWEDADRTCRSAGNVLASPITNKALRAMKSLMGVKNTTYLIGMKSTYYTGPFVSVEGVPLEDMSMDVLDMIDVIDQRDGDCLAMNSDIIRAVPCSSLLPFMCYNTSHFNTTQVPCSPHEEGYKYNATLDSCYKVHTEQKYWAAAEQTCVMEGAHLVVIDNAIEAHNIMNMVMSNVPGQWAWTGLQDLNGINNWISVHGKRVDDLSSSWNANLKPVYGHRRCAIFISTANYSTCDTNRPFICEKAAFS